MNSACEAEDPLLFTKGRQNAGGSPGTKSGPYWRYARKDDAESSYQVIINGSFVRWRQLLPQPVALAQS